MPNQQSLEEAESPADTPADDAPTPSKASAPNKSSEDKAPKKRLLLIDGYSTIFRAFYAIRNLSNSKGEPTNAVYGFIQMLRKLLRDEDPDLVGIAFDVSHKTFRSDRYAEYKANRKPMPDDLKVQMPNIRRAIEGFKIPILELAGFEADDVLGTLGRKASEAGFEVVLVTADKDLFQLVGSGIKLYHTGRDKLYDPALVEEDFGVPPDKVVDVLALMGDSVDNVPGVPGIGEKGAKNLINEYGSLDALLERAGELKRKSYREGLQEHREQALLSRELTVIDTELDVDLDPKDLRYEDPDGEKLFALYRELDFFSLLEELESDGLLAAKKDYPPAHDCDGVNDWKKRIEALDVASSSNKPDASAKKIAVALIENSPNGRNQAIGLAVAPAADLEGADATSSDQTESDRSDTAPPLFADFRRNGLEQAARSQLREWLTDPKVELVGHDLKEVLRFAAQEALETQETQESRKTATEKEPDPTHLEIACRLTDSMLWAYLLRSASRGYSLAEVALERFHHKAMKPDEAGFGTRAEGGEPPMPGLPGLLALASEQTLLPVELVQVMAPEMADPEAGDPREVYREIEEPLVPVLMRIEEAGIELDTGFLAEMSAELGTRVDELEQEIYKIAGEEFNINSPPQLGSILFDKLGYPVLRRTRKTKKYSTSAEILEELAARGFDLPVRLLEYRELSKLKSTYVDALPTLVDESSRLHTRYHQAVAATGRLSSYNPNLQNIPVRSEIGQTIRKAFRASEGYRLLVADYSQIELRVLAHVAREKALIAAFAEGADIHRSTAATVFGVDPSLVTDEQRRAAKTINFGILYGMSAYGLGQRLGIKPKEAGLFIESYFEQFPGVHGYTEETLRQVERDGYVETLYGRCRFLPDIKSRNRNLKENAKRMAINARIQGTAADLLKLAMIATDRKLRQDHPEARLLLTVHDELVAEAPEEQADEVAKLLKQEMEGVAKLAVPLKVDLGSGETWYDAKS